MAEGKNEETSAPAPAKAPAKPRVKKGAAYVVAPGRSISLTVGGIGVIRGEGELVTAEEAGSFDALVTGGFLVEAPKE